VNPGFMNTSLIKAATASKISLLQAAPPEIQAQYSVDVLKDGGNRVIRLAEDPKKVADMIVTLVFARTLELNNFVGIQSAILRTLYMLPHSLLSRLLNPKLNHPALSRRIP
jgi:hypothetical protein